jgi:ribosome-associated translation inhibitor RaiA
MRIDVRDRGFKADDGLRKYVGLRLMSVLDHLARQVNDVAVSLADVRARDGEVGKRCRMLARFAPSGAARIEQTDSDVYAAIDRAAEQLAREVTAARSLGKVRAGAAEAALTFESTKHPARVTEGT